MIRSEAAAVPCLNHNGALPEACPGWCEFSDPDLDALHFRGVTVPDEFAAGTVIDDRFRLVERIGHGGMGTVYRGKHVVLGGAVAVKFLSPQWVENSVVRGRFLSEARALARVRSPNIVGLRQFGVHEGVPYIVMDYVDGEGLDDRLERATTFDEGMRILHSVAQALAVAHRAGIVHNDVKSENVIIGDDGRVTLVDFGLARPYASVCRLAPGEVVGTPAYIAPELAGEWVDAPSPATDLYALGVLAFEVLTGRVPFDDADPQEVLQMHMNDEAPTLASRLPGVPSDLDALVTWCLRKDPHLRIPSADVFARNIAEIRCSVARAATASYARACS